MNYYTGNWQLGNKDLLNGDKTLLQRPFKDVTEHDYKIVESFLNSDFKNGDTLYFLGNVFHELNDYNYHLFRQIKEKFPYSKFILLSGGTFKIDDYLQALVIVFGEDVRFDKELRLNDSNRLYLNPNQDMCREFNKGAIGYEYEVVEVGYKYSYLTCMQESLHNSQQREINVSVDFWHFKPVSEDKVFSIISDIFNATA